MASRTKLTVALEDPQEVTVSDTLSLRIPRISTTPFPVNEVSDESDQTINSSLVTIGRDSEVTTSSTNPDRKSIPETCATQSNPPQSDLGNEPKTKTQKRTLETSKNEEILQRLENLRIKPENHLQEDDQLRDRCMKKLKHRRRSVSKRAQVLRRLFDIFPKRETVVTVKDFFQHFVPYPKSLDYDYYSPPIQGLSNFRNTDFINAALTLPPRVGLINLGNTCFMNASMNVFYSLDIFRLFFTHQRHKQLISISNTLARFFSSYQKTDVVIYLQQLLSDLPDYNDKRQHCAHEFITQVLSKLDQELNVGTSPSPQPAISLRLEEHRGGKCNEFRQIFSILIENVFICQGCFAPSQKSSYSRTLEISPGGFRYDSRSNVLYSEDGFYSPEIAGIYDSCEADKLHDYIAALRAFQVDKEKMCPSGNQQNPTFANCLQARLRCILSVSNCVFLCEKCGCKIGHFKQGFLRHVGSVLLVQIPHHDMKTTARLNRVEGIPEMLDLSEYYAGGKQYTLKGVIHHYEDLRHYTASIKLNRNWYLFNDEIVSQLPNETKLFDDAYILAYEQTPTNVPVDREKIRIDKLQGQDETAAQLWNQLIVNLYTKDISGNIRTITTVSKLWNDFKKKRKDLDSYFTVPIRGLDNIDNTNFMNAALNALYYAQPLHSFFRQLTGHDIINLTQTFKRFVQYYQTHANATSLLYETVRHLPEFGNGRQNCAHSFVLKFLTKLDKDLQCSSPLCSVQASSRYAGKFANYQKNKCKEMHEIFSELVENVFTCSVCFKHWNNFMYSRTLDLPIIDKVTYLEGTAFFEKDDFFNERIAEKYLIPTEENALRYGSEFQEWNQHRGGIAISPSRIRSTLDLCFEYTFRATLMTADNKLECPTCGIETQHYKQSFLRHMGKVLMIHFQRYNEVTGEKLDTYIECPDILPMSKYLPNGGIYVLQSVINHYGSLSGGHYTAYVKVRGKWYEFNDSSVREMSRTEDLFRAAFVVTYVKRC